MCLCACISGCVCLRGYFSVCMCAPSRVPLSVTQQIFRLKPIYCLSCGESLSLQERRKKFDGTGKLL